MKIFYDLEFLERGPELPIQLISIGMVREDGATLYMVNAEMPLSAVVRHPWLQLNVVPHLPISYPNPGIIEWNESHPDYAFVKARDEIARQVLEFCTEEGRPEFWAYYGAYDHVVLAQLFGTMTDYPPGLPQYTNDVVQLWASLGAPEGVLPDGTDAAEHHALADAQYVRDAWRALDYWSRQPMDGYEEPDAGFIGVMTSGQATVLASQRRAQEIAGGPGHTSWRTLRQARIKEVGDLTDAVSDGVDSGA